MSDFLSTWLMAETADQDCIRVKKIYIDINDGNLADGVLFSQIVYWHGLNRETKHPRMTIFKDDHLWLAKQYSEWFEECRINAETARASINRMVNRGLLIKHVYRFNGLATVHLRIDPDVFEARVKDQQNKCAETAINHDPVTAINRKPKRGVIANRIVSQSQTGNGRNRKPLTDTTTETTTENEDSAASLPLAAHIEAPSQPDQQNGQIEIVAFQDVKEHWHPDTRTWDDGYVYIGREMFGTTNLPRSKWCNPYRLNSEAERLTVIEQFEQHLKLSPELMAALPELRGKILVCWCKHHGKDVACHGDVLKRYAESAEPEPLAYLPKRGDPVWHHTHVGGYQYSIKYAAVVLYLTAARATILFKTKAGTFEETSVPLEKLTVRDEPFPDLDAEAMHRNAPILLDEPPTIPAGFEARISPDDYAYQHLIIPGKRGVACKRTPMRALNVPSEADRRRAICPQCLTEANKPKDETTYSKEVKDALAITCYGNADAWKIDSNAKAMNKTLRELSAAAPVTVEALRTFYKWWKDCDYRGKKGERPEPRHVTDRWYPAQSGNCDPVTSPKPSTPTSSGEPDWRTWSSGFKSAGIPPADQPGRPERKAS